MSEYMIQFGNHYKSVSNDKRDGRTPTKNIK